MVDSGAAKAILESRKSLLAIGITSVKGNFRASQVVEILGPQGQVIGKGRVNYSSAQIQRIKGIKSSRLKELFGEGAREEVIHADHLAL